MIKIKRSKKIFFRSFFISLVILSCIVFGATLCGKAYKAIQLTGFGKHREAFEITENEIRIFDIEIKIKKEQMQSK